MFLVEFGWGLTYPRKKILLGVWEISLDWPQTFGRVNPQTFGQAIGVVIDNSNLIAWAYFPLNMSMVLKLPPFLSLCDWLFVLVICGLRPGYDILGVGVHRGRFLLPNPPRGLLPFLRFLTLPIAVPPVWGGFYVGAVYVHVLPVAGVHHGDHSNFE